MINFSLNPNKKLWNTSERFPDAKQLFLMYDEYPDETFTPWLFHMNLGHSDIYIKKGRKYWLIICRNVTTKYPLTIENGYIKGTYETFFEAYTMFRRLCMELLEKYKEIKNYGVPF